ncbi:MAG: hypothetical protein ACXAC6_09345 [Candidatus Hodarchaeales archaeon]
MNNHEYRLLLTGKLITPLVTKKTHFTLYECQAAITNPRRRYYTKINASKPMYPYSYICYLGTLVIEFRHTSLTVLRHKLNSILQKTHIGRLRTEGLGQIKWIGGYIDNNTSQMKREVRKRKLRIRKGLPSKLTVEQQQLLKFALLHDFFHTSKHQSKIYREPPLTDKILVEQLRNHHDKSSDPFIQQFQYYDRLAASITRKIRSPIISRYNWHAKRKLQKIDFRKLAKEIQEVAETNIWNLYYYIYKSKELQLLNESMNHGHTTLQNHLVVIANLIVQDFVHKSKQRNMHKLIK